MIQIAFLNAFNNFKKGKKSKKIKNMDFREQHVRRSSELIGNNVIVQNIINNHLAKKNNHL
ncbi:hypothetical protein ABE28_011895 [Peribacillus muralis]|uniref:Uncharacterized protein n=2 Tax=Peribacillus TaxID=2675229 RepID=A0A1B3XPA6_9BACI|nr:hypothetical protein ABE28_011895 [Peribacillus muralis]KWW17337.1 hypothetical protein AS888_22310 [Peribacillus simplex]PJN91780.1 hypothetical protein CVN76_02840 [Bacillus sp. mrc49]